MNLYGAHPFYLAYEHDGKATGVLFLNSNTVEMSTSSSAKSIYFKSIGGVFDFSIFVGDSSLDVITLYHLRIGTSFLPPIRSLGFHLSRWGYNTTQYMKSVMDSMIAADIPVDVQWNDIDYMNENEDFTVSERFSELPQYVEFLHSLGKKYVVMIDPAIFVGEDPSYKPYQSGVEANVFIKNRTGDIIVGKVWPGLTAFPDFLWSQTKDWWGYWIQYLRKSLPFDGVWIDMNEPQSFSRLFQ